MMIRLPEGTCLRAILLSSVAAVYAFQSTSTSARVGSALKSTVDPSTITTKEYQDICGTSFDDGSLQERLSYTNFLYPKHVEVVQDIAPIAGAMVDNMVSLGNAVTLGVP